MPPRAGKTLHVEKIDLKFTKNRFFGYGTGFLGSRNLLLSENRMFRPWILKITITKYSLAKTTLKTAYNDGFILLLTFMIDTINYWILDKNYAFLRTFTFAWILWRELSRNIFYSLIFEALDQGRRIELLTHQRKELVNQNWDTYDWKRIDEWTVTWLY